MKKYYFYIILTLTLILIPFGFSNVQAQDFNLSYDFYNIEGCKTGNTIEQCKAKLLAIADEVVSVASTDAGIANIDSLLYPDELKYLGEKCAEGEDAYGCYHHILDQIDIIIELSKPEYTCDYTSQRDGSKLIIEKYPKNWLIIYPDNDLNFYSTTNVSLGNVLPSSNCEDVFLVINKDQIHAIDANSKNAGVLIAQVCNGYNNDVGHFCHNGTCKITNPICGNEKQNEDNEYIEGECPKDLKPAFIFLKRAVFNLVQIVVPIILILMGTIDFTKAVVATDEKNMKEAVPKFIKRILAAILMYFVVTIVSLVISLFAKTDLGPQDDWKACWNNIK